MSIERQSDLRRPGIEAPLPYQPVDAQAERERDQDQDAYENVMQAGNLRQRRRGGGPVWIYSAGMIKHAAGPERAQERDATVCPKLRVSAIMLDTTPNRSRGAVPMMALLLGDLKKPMPSAKGVKRKTYPIAPVLRSSVRTAR